MRHTTFVDTSVLRRIIGMDGSELQAQVVREFDARTEAGQNFIIPVTAVIELGNQICQSSGDRRRYAKYLVRLIGAAMEGNPPWIIRSVAWDEQTLTDLCAGDSTGSDLVSLLGDGRMGTGDVAILVERDQFREETAAGVTEVWSLDAELAAHGAPG